VVTKTTHAHKCTQVSYIMNVMCVLHVSDIFVAILREAHHKGWMYRDITKFMIHCILAQYILAQYVLAQYILAQYILAQYILTQYVLARYILAQYVLAQ